MNEERKIRCRTCEAFNDSARSTCEKCGEILIPEGTIFVNDGNTVFMAESSDGFLEHQSGFFRRIGDKWIVAELTLLRGLKMEKTKAGLETTPCVQPILVFNRCSERGYQSLKSHSIELDGKTIVLEGTPAYKPLETLLSYDTVVSFLKGRNEDLATIYPNLKDRIAKFVNVEWDPRLLDLVTTIAIATYFFDVFSAFPIIFPYGPHETGKSRLVKCIVYAGRKGLLYVSPTPAPIFRAIDAFRPTLGIDEFTKIYEELMQLARAIYKKGLLVPRMEKSRGQKFFLTLFETYTPLIVASTEELDPVTMSRTIIINMRKAKELSKRDPEPWDFEDIRDKLYICRLTHAHTVDQAKNELDKANVDLIGREYELWRPILTIAKVINEKTFESLLQLAKELGTSKFEGLYENEKDVLSAISEMFSPQTTLDKEKASELIFYPKQIADILFTQKKAEYGAEESGSDKIDAAMHVEARKKFERAFGPKKIGWVLKRLGLRYLHKTQGNEYHLSFKEFSDLKKRFGMEK